MLDGCLAAPGDLFPIQAEDGGNLVALGRAGGPAAQKDSQHAAFFQTGFYRQLLAIDLVLLTQVTDGFSSFHRTPPLESWAAAELRTMAVHVLHLLREAPGNLACFGAEGRRQTLPLLRTGRVTAMEHGVQDLGV